jgi:hypothetical protein
MSSPNDISLQLGAFPPPPPPSSEMNEGAVREFLAKHCWPDGLQSILISSLKRIPLRFFICDDSGSMMSDDGHRLVKVGEVFKYVTQTALPTIYSPTHTSQPFAI